VAVLLVLTICYCMLLMARRLKRLKARASSQATIADLITATDSSGAPRSGLKHNGRDFQRNLGNQLCLRRADGGALKNPLAECENVVRGFQDRPRVGRATSSAPERRR